MRSLNSPSIRLSPLLRRRIDGNDSRASGLLNLGAACMSGIESLQKVYGASITRHMNFVGFFELSWRQTGFTSAMNLLCKFKSASTK